MKKEIVFLIVSIFISFLLITFIKWDFNPKNWGLLLRVMLLFVSAIIFGIIKIIEIENHETKRSY